MNLIALVVAAAAAFAPQQATAQATAAPAAPAVPAADAPVVEAREALRQALEACGGPGAAIVQTEHHTARLQKGGKSVSVNPQLLPPRLCRVKLEPDKALIKAALQKKQTVPGAVLVTAPPSLVITSKEK